MAAGYIYILVNSSMPGLVKVGKTSRLPSERSAELSGVTGVATPFVVAFEQFFVDCDAAEDFIHAELELRGLRQSDSREFFRATPSEVVKIVLNTPGTADPAGVSESDDANSDAETDLLPSESLSDDLMLTGLRPQRPWDAVYEMAENCYYGFGDYIQDYGEALKLYQDAARLGSSLAYEKIGNVLRYGDGIKEDVSKAIRYYKEGAKKGNYFCWAQMATLFANNDQMDNCTKCFARYFRERSERLTEEVEEYPEKHVGLVYRYIQDFLDHDLQPEFEPHVRVYAEAVEEYARISHERRIARRDHTDFGDSEEYMDRTLHPLNWIIDHRRGDTPRSFSVVPTPQAVERLAPPPVTPPKRWWRR